MLPVHNKLSKFAGLGVTGTLYIACVCVHAYMRRVCVHAYMQRVCVCIHVTCVCVCVCACIHVTYICACIHAMCVCVCVCIPYFFDQTPPSNSSRVRLITALQNQIR